MVLTLLFFDLMLLHFLLLLLLLLVLPGVLFLLFGFFSPFSFDFVCLILVFIHLFNSFSFARSGTCPVCRETLTEDAEGEEEEEGTIDVEEEGEVEEEEDVSVMGVDEEEDLLAPDLVEVVVLVDSNGEEEEATGNEEVD